MSDAFDFNSEVSVFLQFNALEQLLFEEIKSQMTNSDYAFYWSEMRSYDFSDFIKNEKFAIVMKLIRKYVQKFSKLVNIVNTLTEHKLKNFYLFKPQILEESHMEDDDSSSVFNSGPTKANIILIHADIREKLSKPTEEEDKSDDSSNDEEEFDFKVLPSLESSTPSFLLEKTEPKKKKTKYIRKSTEFIRHRKSKRGSVSIRNIQGDLKSAFKRINFYEAVDLDSNIKEEKGCLEKIVIPGFKNLEYHIDEKLIDENSIRTNDDGSKEENQEIRKFNMHLLWVIFIMMVVFIFVTLIITLVFD